MPDLKDIIKDNQTTINKQKYQIEQLQKDLYKMFVKIKELNASLERDKDDGQTRDSR